MERISLRYRLLALILAAGVIVVLVTILRPTGTPANRIAFIYTTEGTAGLYTIGPEGAGRAGVAVSTTAPDWFDGLLSRVSPARQGQLRPYFYPDRMRAPAWLGSSGAVGFHSRQVGDSCEWLETAVPDAGSSRKIACLPFSLREEAFAWAPDGSRYAFAARDNDITSLRIVGVDGGSVHHSVLDETVWGLSFSPDSALVAVTLDGEPSLRIYSISGLADVLELPSTSAISRPAWSPDSRALAFFCITSDLYLPRTDVCTIGLDGSGFRKVALDQPFPYIKTDLQWSPSGDRLSFVAVTGSGYNDIFLMDPDGSNLVQLTSHSAGDSDPAWSADGLLIVFSSNRDGNWELYTIRADGTQLTRLTDTPGDEMEPAWQLEAPLVNP